MPLKSARDLIDDEIHRAKCAAARSNGAERDQIEADVAALEGILLTLRTIKESRLRVIEQAEAFIARDGSDIEWPSIRNGAAMSIEMLERLGAGPDHDELVEAQRELAKARQEAGHDANEAREHAQFLRERYARLGMGPGAIAQRLRIDATLQGRSR